MERFSRRDVCGQRYSLLSSVTLPIFHQPQEARLPRQRMARSRQPSQFCAQFRDDRLPRCAPVGARLGG